jgi:hypothetical protein
MYFRFSKRHRAVFAPSMMATVAVAACMSGCHNGDPVADKTGVTSALAGVTTQDTAARIRSVQDQVRSSGQISDADLDWMLGLTGPTSNSIVNAKVCATVGALRSASADQKSRIQTALTPLQSSSDPLTKKSASGALRKLASLS